jgi:hypothetical protein
MCLLTAQNEKAALAAAFINDLISRRNLERAKGFEPSTPTLAMVGISKKANKFKHMQGINKYCRRVV